MAVIVQSYMTEVHRDYGGSAQVRSLLSHTNSRKEGGCGSDVTLVPRQTVQAWQLHINATRVTC